MQEECTILKRPLIVVRNSTERPESVDAGFSHLVQPGPVIGGLGRQLIGDEGLSARLAAIPCPFGDGTASERITGCLRGYAPLTSHSVISDDVMREWVRIRAYLFPLVSQLRHKFLRVGLLRVF